MKALKSLMTMTLLVGILSVATAQKHSRADYFRIGIKGGVNLSSVKVASLSANLENKTGYQLGAFARIGRTVFFQPEVYFAAKEVNVDVLNSLTTNQGVVGFSQKSLDVPLLLGVKLGPLRVMAGPVATYAISASTNPDAAVKSYFSGTTQEIINRSSFSYQAGVGFDILNLSLDLRYEGAMSELNNTIAVPNGFNYSQKPSYYQATIGFRIL
ncbi:porin family protein [Aquirufa antheringensis]|uniref:porin family protein n=1 Tax=Aquirufa antheringensis TaxID=2516559 RepID=UPI001032F946|nr:porin family protein [Aquirufa antheringensis]TBH70115.1 PorT family protein [Aquirufa antheringensis]